MNILSIVKNSAFLVAIAANHVSGKSSSRNSSNQKNAAIGSGWVQKPEPSEDPYMAASTPGRIVSVSRRSITFYGDETKDLDYGHLIGASFVKKRPTEDDQKHGHSSDSKK